jgi:FkbM family methyltransferase
MMKHFQNPLLIPLARLGVLKIDYCSFDVHNDHTIYKMLARPLGGDHRILREVLVEETYRSILELLPSRGLRVVDIGSHIGAFIVWLHRQHAVEEAFCFEPEADSFCLCRFNAGWNECENVRLYQQAIGGLTRDSEMWIDPIAHARSSLQSSRRSPASYRVKIPVIALSDWVMTVNGNFDLLKMDCEASEWEILECCPDAFSRFSLIVAEIHRDPRGTRDAQRFATELERLGFATLLCDKPTHRADTLYIGRRDTVK